MANNINDYAIVVGIDNYAQLRRLRASARDAVRFAEWLSSPEGGGLPRNNVYLIVSQAELLYDPLDARPLQSDVDNALLRFVGSGGARVGRRLYFYFAGHGFGPTFDDVGMLMANASTARLGSNIGLRPYRLFFRETGLFDEVVFILDCSRDPYLSVSTAAPTLSVRTGNSVAQLKEMVILAAAHGGKAFTEITPDAREPRGALTEAVLDGLTGGAADQLGRITSSGLSAYLRRRVPELTPELGQAPEVILPDVEIVFKELPSDDGKGTLIVELPHWTAGVDIRDQFESVPDVGAIKPGAQPGVYVSETKLPPGIYEVEVTLEGKSAQQKVGVFPNQNNIITQDAWAGLALASAAPLSGAVTTNMDCADAARKWSRETTWDAGSNSGDSSFFLFMSATDPEAHRRFAASLFLLDSEGNLVTRFSGDEVERDEEGEWVAFNAKLKPGYYVLRRGRHYRIRQQAIFLCPGWQTQVFLKTKTRRRPSLRLMTLNMVRPGDGFEPEDETAIAAEAVLDLLRYGRKSKQLLTSEKMAALLRGKVQNPWLGILAAYALRPSGLNSGTQQSEDEWPSLQLSTSEGREYQETAALFSEVMGFLSREIGDHPDVRALRLMSEGAVTPFPHPPLLRVGLKLVQRHATRVEETIPLHSLTDLVLDNLLLNSPWTAWRELVLPSTDPPLSSPFAEDALIAVTKGRSRTRRAPAPINEGISAEALLQSETPSAPVFNLSAEDEATDTAESAFRAEPNPATSATALYEAMLIQEAPKLTQSVEADSPEEKHELDFKKLLDDLLVSVKAEDISGMSGMPLSRAREGLERLRRYSDVSLTLDGVDGAIEESLSPDTKAVFKYALRKGKTVIKRSARGSAQRGQVEYESIQSSDGAEAAESASPLQLAPSATSVTIEGIVLKLRGEANRLLHTEDDEAVARELASGLQSVSDKLLRHADFTVITTPQGRMLRGNGAFLALISPSAGADSASGGGPSNAKETRRENYRAWESLLSGASAGHSVIPSPIPNSICTDWELRRIAIEDNLKKVTQAYLNVLRCQDSPQLAESSLLSLDLLMPELALDASYFAHGDAKRRQEYAQSLRALTQKLEDVIHTARPAADGLDDDEAVQDLADNNMEGHSMINSDDTHQGDASAPLIDDPELKMPDATMYESEFWGIARHELIAGAAEEKMTSEKAKKAVQRILAPLGGLMLSDIAGWADKVKRRAPDPANDDEETVAFLEDDRNRTNDQWHYVNLPLDAEEYNRDTYPEFTRDDDVVQIMRECIRVLQGQSDRFSELNALRLLAHLAGDVHQPAHVGCCYIDDSSTPAKLVRSPQVAAQKELEHDQGGNKVLLPIGNSGVSLHSYWDSRLGGSIKLEQFLDEANAPAAPPEPMEGDAPTSDPKLKQKFISKLSAMIQEDPPANQSLAESAEADVVPPELRPQQWASESLVAAREAYKSLKITEGSGNKFIVAWEGKETYDTRCKPLVIQQMKLAAQNLATLLDETLG